MSESVDARALTVGETRVRVNFNVSNDDVVTQIKPIQKQYNADKPLTPTLTPTTIVK
jgi:hypothetical protein